MHTWNKNIFVRVIARRVEEESRAKEDIITEYQALTETEKTEILAAIV
ncbi:hypothetical protein [Wukongibacter sp. M2B1]